MKNTTITRAAVQSLRVEIMDALAPIMKKHGLKADLGRITFEVGKEFRGKLTVVQPALDVKPGEKPKVGENWHFGRNTYHITEVHADHVIGRRACRTRRFGFVPRQYRIKMLDITLNGIKVK